MALIRGFISLILVLVALGCQTTSEPGTFMLPDFNDAGSADAGTYSASSMFYRKPMPDHSDWKPVEFYFKHCSELGDQVYYSKTSYGCSGPF